MVRLGAAAGSPNTYEQRGPASAAQKSPDYAQQNLSRSRGNSNSESYREGIQLVSATERPRLNADAGQLVELEQPVFAGRANFVPSNANSSGASRVAVSAQSIPSMQAPLFRHSNRP